MSSNTLGDNFRITTFGESHGKALGVVIDGVMPGLAISEDEIQKELDKRKPGQSKITTSRKEEDKVHILSGIFEGKTTGTPICLLIYNKDADSSHYDNIKKIFRPGHADFTYFAKYGIRDHRGGGRASGRETVARVAAGAVAKKILSDNGIKIIAHTKEIAGIKSVKFNEKEIYKNDVRCADKEAAMLMGNAIAKSKSDGDSLGGIVEVIAYNVPPGLGDPVFDKLDADLAKALISIPAVKGIEFGTGFDFAKMKGSQANDEFIKQSGKIVTKTNNAGGIQGGISNGMPIVARVVVKPTPSISKEQQTVDIKGNKANIKIQGRHDPCICPRVVPVVESMVAIVLADAFLKQKQIR